MLDDDEDNASMSEENVELVLRASDLMYDMAVPLCGYYPNIAIEAMALALAELSHDYSVPVDYILGQVRDHMDNYAKQAGGELLANQPKTGQN